MCDFAGLGDVISEFYELLTVSQVVDDPTFDGGLEVRFMELRIESRWRSTVSKALVKSSTRRGCCGGWGVVCSVPVEPDQSGVL